MSAFGTQVNIEKTTLKQKPIPDNQPIVTGKGSLSQPFVLLTRKVLTDLAWFV